ncbi:MAG: hypothetical protein N2V78_01670 [Methanophagales archaeon]|nr:hypothetical protein [Methanophagales archaeon]
MAKKIDLKRIKKFIYKKFEIIIFFILSFFIINSFEGWNYIHQFDSLFMLNPEKYLYDVLYFWKDGRSFGFGLPEFGQIPFYAFQVFLIKTFSLFIDSWKSLVLSQMIMYYFTVFFSFLFGYLFFKEFFKVFFDEKDLQLKGRLILTLVTFFYVINLHTIIWIFWRYIGWSLFWVGLPLLGYLYLKYLECNEKSKDLRYIFCAGAIFITPIAAGFTSVGFLFLYFLFSILTVFYYLKTDKKLCYLAKKSILFTLIFSILISWILIPQFTSLKMVSEYSSALMTVGNREILDYASQFSTILNCLRLIGKSSFQGGSMFSWADSYLSNEFINILLFLYPMIILLSLFLICKEKDSRIKKVYLVINIILLFLLLLMKGTSEPFKNMGYLLLNIHPVFFRHPHDRFIHLYVVLLSLVFLYLLYKLSSIKKYKKLFIVIVLFFFLSFSFLNYPYFTGEVVHPSDRVRIPESYLNLSSEIHETLDLSKSRVLVIPFSFSEYSYNLSGRINHPNTKSLSYNFLDSANVIQFSYSFSEKRVLEYLSELIYSNKYREFVDFSGSIGIDYILVHKDYSEKYVVDFTKYLARTAIKFVDNLERKELIKKVFENDNIVIYSLNTKSKLFTTEGKPLLMFGNLSILPSLDFITSLNDVSAFSLSPSTYALINVTDNILVKESTPVNEFIANLKQNSPYIHRENAVFTSSKKGPTSCTPTEKDLLIDYSFENVLNKWNFPNKTIIYLFEAESDLYRDNAEVLNIGGEASNGEVLELADGKAWQEVEIINNGTYRLAIRVKGDFRVQIENKTFEFHNSNLTYWYSPIFELNGGTYNLTITPLNIPVANFSFELPPSIDTENVMIEKLPQGIASFSNDSFAGKSSLKVSSNVTEEGWLWFRTTEIDVTPRERYLAITHMKYENVVESYISIEGYNETSEEWRELGQIPSRQNGTSDWKEYKQMLTIPEDITKIGFVLNAGWIEDPGEGNATTWFDDIRIYPVKDFLDVTWLYSTKNNETLNELFKTNETPPEVIGYTKINPTKYEVKVNATKPFMLSFAESYDPLWEARVYKDGEKVEVAKSIPLYSVINGFWIDETGDLEIEIRYKPQDWFELGLWISGITFIFCIGFLFYDWRRERRAERLEKKVKKWLRRVIKKE